MNSSFDNDFKQAKKLAVIGMIISVSIGMSVTGFVVWVIIKLMQHFWVI